MASKAVFTSPIGISSKLKYRAQRTTFSMVVIQVGALSRLEGIRLSNTAPTISHFMFAIQLLVGPIRKGEQIRWLSWEALGKPRTNGGMGFRILPEFNLALITKHCWRRLINGPNSLWEQNLKARRLTGHQNGRLQLRNMQALDLKQLVEIIINPVTREWELSPIRQQISNHEASVITRIRLMGEQDRLIWPFARSGSYSVRSGYH
ncbi:PREDICTED: reverse mRNAase [Prunus dulcis]|uniref:PREDICTED: reverse mRNAase n=1 Tax=Prunus dulcis TaxID=3755 RepID=A0A5E4FHV8_PRUDU|nr:PREDICTED: reverse mRNAase [Prunus dulcis]